MKIANTKLMVILQFKINYIFLKNKVLLDAIRKGFLIIYHFTTFAQLKTNQIKIKL